MLYVDNYAYMHIYTLYIIVYYKGVAMIAQVNPVLAGYFSRTATALMSKHQNEVLDYLRRRGPDRLMDDFLKRIHFRPG